MIPVSGPLPAEPSSRTARIVFRTILATASALARLLRWSVGHVALVLTLVVGGAVAVLFTAGAGEVYESVVEADGISRLDQPVLDVMVGLRSPGLDAAATRFTDLGGTVGMPVLATLATVALGIAWRRWTPIVLMIGAAAGSLLMTVGGKDLAGRARPPVELAVPPLEHSASFPSGHTLNATVIVGVLTYLVLVRVQSLAIRRATLVFGVAFVLTMGLSRVYLGHHWLSDVVAAWSIGLGWVAVVITAHRVMIIAGRAAPLERSGRPRRGPGPDGESGAGATSLQPR